MKTKAVLFGVNYCDTESELKGPVNDIENMKLFLKSINFDNICTYTDAVSGCRDDVTGKGILKILNNLVTESYKDELDIIFLYWSGHGTSIECNDGDEDDGQDECICPVDYDTNGLITDDMLSDIIHMINHKTKVIFVCDSCHSGTILDLKYHYLIDSHKYLDTNRGGLVPKIICISGCLDSQTSADAYNLYNMQKYSGALTSCFLDIMLLYPECKNNVFLLLSKLHIELQKFNLDQLPQLTSSYELKKDSIFLPNIF